MEAFGGPRRCPVCNEAFTSREECPVHRVPLQQADPLIGQILKGTYRIEEQIAAGGMGVVYRATQLPIERTVAVKAIVTHQLLSEEMIERFLREAKLLSQVSHPNVVALFDFGGPDDGVFYMVMEYLVGCTLDAAVPLNQGLPVATILNLMEQIIAGVEAAHRLKVIHRDLKPANIFLADADVTTVKLLDFGVAKPLEQAGPGLTQVGMMIGTTGYMSPEQISGEAPIDARSDVYALGGLLYYMLAGRPAYTGNTTGAVLTKQLTSPPSRIDLSLLRKPEAVGLVPIIDQAMAVDPAQRYQTAQEMLEAIRAACGGPAAGPPVLPRWKTDNKKGQAFRAKNEKRPNTSGPTLLAKSSRDTGQFRRSTLPGHRRLPVVLVLLFLLLGGGALGGVWWFTHTNAQTTPEEQAERPSTPATPATEHATPTALAGPVWPLGKIVELPGERLRAQPTAAVHVALSPDGRYLIASGLDPATTAPVVLAYDLGRPPGEPIERVSLEHFLDKRPASAVAAGLEGRFLVGSYAPSDSARIGANGVCDWQPWTTKAAPGRWPTGQLTPLVLALSAQGNRAASFCPEEKQQIQLWDLTRAKSAEPILLKTPNPVPPRLLAFSTDGALLYAVGPDRSILVWDVATRNLTPIPANGPNRHEGTIACLAVSPLDGKHFVTAGLSDYKTIWWDAESGKPLRTLHQGGNTIGCLAISPDGKWVASGGYDKKVRLDDAEGKAPAVVVREHAGKVLALAFSADGKYVISVGDDLAVYRSVVPSR